VSRIILAEDATMRYEVVEDWEQLPKGYEHRDVAGVAVDGEDRVFLICRGDHPIIAYDRKGSFLRSWGEGEFTYRTHGISTAPDGTVWCTDDGNHTVRQFTPEGKLLKTLGTLDRPSDTGYDGRDYMTIQRAAGPFNRPTNIAIGPNGDLYVSDGYGNSRVHQFSANGTLKRSWGEPGTGPGQFYIPHGIAVAADGRVFVCDRESDRIQIFSPDGEYLTEWTDTQRPTHLVFDGAGRAYVSELWWHPGQTSRRQPPPRALGHARSHQARQLRRAPRPRRRFEGRRLRRRSHLDLRSEPRARARRLPHIPEVRVEEVVRRITRTAAATVMRAFPAPGPPAANA
jgi:sugar lactone lactonase YvrE